MKLFLLIFVFITVTWSFSEGQNYRSGRRNYAAGRRSYSRGGRCPARPCTLQLIPPECRRREFFEYNGRLCPGCYIDICNGFDNGIGGGLNPLPNNQLPMGFVVPQ